MEKANRWLTESNLIFIVMTLFLLTGSLLAHAEGSEPSKAVFYVH